MPRADQLHRQAAENAAQLTVAQVAENVRDQARQLSHPAERQQLAELHQMLRAQVSDQAAITRLEQLEQRQRHQLEARQGNELTTLEALVTASERLEQIQARQREQAASSSVDDRQSLAGFHERQRRELDELMASTLAASDKLRGESDLRQKVERTEAARALREADLIQALDQVLAAQQQMAREGERQANGFKAHLRRQLDDILSRLTPNKLVDVRSRAELDQRVSDDALQRIVREGQRSPAGNRVSAVKGQLAEELNAERAEQEARQDATGKTTFLHPDRIRDESGRKLTDGLLVQRNEETGRLQVVKAFEVKAGENAARELLERITAMTNKFREQTALYARDSVLDREVRQRENEAIEQWAARQERWAAVHAAELAAEAEAERQRLEENQREAGQLDATIERLHESTEAGSRIYVDGIAEELELDLGRADIEGVVPRDVELDDVRVRQLGVTADELRRAAEAVAAWLDEQTRVREER